MWPVTVYKYAQLLSRGVMTMACDGAGAEPGDPGISSSSSNGRRIGTISSGGGGNLLSSSNGSRGAVNSSSGGGGNLLSSSTVDRRFSSSIESTNDSTSSVAISRATEWPGLGWSPPWAMAATVVAAAALVLVTGVVGPGRNSGGKWAGLGFPWWR